VLTRTLQNIGKLEKKMNSSGGNSRRGEEVRIDAHDHGDRQGSMASTITTVGSATYMSEADTMEPLEEEEKQQRQQPTNQMAPPPRRSSSDIDVSVDRQVSTHGMQRQHRHAATRSGSNRSTSSSSSGSFRSTSGGGGMFSAIGGIRDEDMELSVMRTSCTDFEESECTENQMTESQHQKYERTVQALASNLLLPTLSAQNGKTLSKPNGGRKSISPNSATGGSGASEDAKILEREKRLHIEEKRLRIEEKRLLIELCDFYDEHKVRSCCRWGNR
jgi:hypothetical protein